MKRISELVSISKLKVDGQNPNRMTPKQLERLSTSIQKYGFVVPIITNKDLLVADGEQRLTTARALGMKQVPVIRLPIEDVDRRLLRQVLNKLRGEHDLVADAYEFERIVKAGHEDELKHLLDLSDSSLERYLAEIHEPKPEDFEIDKIETDIRRGDIYKLGKHRLMCGDATIKQDVVNLMNGNTINMIFTDPPYGVAFNKHHLKKDIWKRTHTKTRKGSSGFKNWGGIRGDKSLSTYFKFIELMAKMAPAQSWYLCSPSRHLGKILDKLDECNVYYATPLVWVKEHWVMSWERYHAQHENLIFCGDGAHPTGKKSIWYGKTNETTVWKINRDNLQEANYHPAQKPLDLIRRALLNSSRQGDVVYDGFGGSGSTLIACEQTRRICYMMEIDPRYCQVIINRWESYTGQKAEKLN